MGRLFSPFRRRYPVTECKVVWPVSRRQSRQLEHASNRSVRRNTGQCVIASAAPVAIQSDAVKQPYRAIYIANRSDAASAMLLMRPPLCKGASYEENLLASTRTHSLYLLATCLSIAKADNYHSNDWFNWSYIRAGGCPHKLCITQLTGDRRWTSLVALCKLRVVNQLKACYIFFHFLLLPGHQSGL